MDLNLTKSEFNILLQAITQVSTQLDDFRAEVKRDFMTKKDFKKEMKKYATKEDLKKFATKEDLKKFATKDDLKRFATKDDVRKELKKELKNYPTKKELRDGLKATKDELREELHYFAKTITNDVVNSIQPSIAALEETVEKHDKALKAAGLLH